MDFKDSKNISFASMFYFKIFTKKRRKFIIIHLDNETYFRKK